MTSKIKNQNNQTNFFEIIKLIEANKLKIFLISALSVFVMFIYVNFKSLDQNQIKYNVSTKINPISIFDEIKYFNYNSYADKNYNTFAKAADNYQKEGDINEIPTINKQYLLSLYLAKLNDRESIIKNLKKTDFLKKKDFKINQDYEKALISLASTFNLKLIIDDAEIKTWYLNFNTNNKNSLTDFLKILNTEINLEVREYLNNLFNSFIESEKKSKQFQIDDINIMIDNLIEKYENDISSRIAYLDEQAKIARKLDIKELNIEVNIPFNDKASQSASTIQETYYLRGYEAIESEIELIKQRENKKAFTKGLNELLYSRNSLISNLNSKRLQNEFKNTPIGNLKDFKAADIDFLSIKILSQNKKLNMIKMLFLAGLFGLIIGTIFILLIPNNLKKYL